MSPFPQIDVRATGKNIDQLLKQHHISIRTLQTFFGFDSPRAIYKWLRGEHLPSVDHLYALGKLLNTPLQDILIGRSQDDQDVPFMQPWRLFDLIQRNLSDRGRFFVAAGTRLLKAAPLLREVKAPPMRGNLPTRAAYPSCDLMHR